MEYWIGPLEVANGRIPGYWERTESRHDVWVPAYGAPAKFFGDEKNGIGRIFKISDENLVDFQPKYFSHRILTFLTARGACYDGALCWAQLPPALLAFQAVVDCADEKKYPHEQKFFRLLLRKFPRIFIKDWADLKQRPPLGLLKHPAAEWGL